MVYQGSKERIAKYILPYIQTCIDDNNLICYIEPFVGGANMIDKVNADLRVGIDNNRYLINLLSYMSFNPAIPAAPVDCDFEYYKKIREAYNKQDFTVSNVDKAIVGFFASYGGRFFDGGFARDKAGKRNQYKERLANARKQAPLLKDICFEYGDYTRVGRMANTYNDVLKCKHCFIYCDPPYAGTKKYREDFNSGEFYSWAESMSKDNFLLVSEYDMPDNWVCIWKKERKVTQKSDRIKADIYVEGLWTLKGGLYYNWMLDFSKRECNWICDLLKGDR